MPQGRMTQLIAIVVCFALFGLSGFVSADLTASAGRHKLSYTETAEEGDPPQVALGIAMGAFRGLFVNILWIRANELKEEGKYYEAVDLARAITRLQPRFPQVWAFHAWNMAYNISVTTNTPSERWNWVSQGIDLLRSEGIVHNPTDMVVHKELAWLFLHKVQAFADDAHWYYKLQLAAEWHETLGPPPMPDPGNNTRAERIALFEAWLQPIVDAPSTMPEVVQANPKVEELVDRIAALDFDPSGQRLLRNVTRVRVARASAVWPELRDSADDRFLNITELVHDPEFEQAWADLLAFTRRKVLTERYNMEPRRMLRYTSTYGPLDWRHPASHALYWGQKGVEGAMTRFDFVNSQNYDFINTDRMVVHSIQELWRTGNLWFDYNGMMLNRDQQPFYLGIPDTAYIPVYGEILGDVSERSYYEGDERAYSSYAAGYENFMKDAIRFVYRRGQREIANRMKNELATFEFANLNDSRRAQWLAQDIDRFVQAEVADRLGSPSVALQEVTGSLQEAILTGLVGGDTDVFESAMGYAQQFHAAYLTQQLRENAQGGIGRMEFLDRRFDFVAGQVFASILPMLDIDLAQQAYYNAPEDMRRWAYDELVMRFRPVFDDEEGNPLVEGRGFDAVFPEPAGMPQFREMVDREFNSRRRDLQRELK
ncbi:MAG: hypothetical protein HRU13_00780 [Phycisphaerales bacterium]|nr:hypothetical protein [Phycisphaerales bacterium]